MCIVIIDGDTGDRVFSRVTSRETDDYNAFAWAAGNDDRWWGFDEDFNWWPPNVERRDTLDAFLEAYGSLGYTVCETLDPDLVEGFEKIALYARNGQIEHACRQLSSGRWTSKIGHLEDVKHDFVRHFVVEIQDKQENLGELEFIMKRPIQLQHNPLIENNQ